MTYQPSHMPCDHNGTSGAATSWKAFCETSFAKRFDLHGYQRMFPETAAKYFRSTGLTAAEIGVAFGVSARTGQNWLDGIVAPAGNKVALIAKKDPEGFRKYFVEDAA